MFDETGALLLDVGPHVISESPGFAQSIGAIAASWAQTEVNLNCLFAVLLDTTPEEAANELKKHRSAAKTTHWARKRATEILKGEELLSLIETLDRLDEVRLRRNRVQHDVWSRKANDVRRIFAIHSDEYLALTTELVASSEDTNLAISVAKTFAEKISDGFSIEDLEAISTEIHSVSHSLLCAMFRRIVMRLAARSD
ncbi:hypothetical protein QFW77_05885 [Luteimonas sp. RD2P54]|uniref:Cthe-2314-like HEPN domain-containing protein n=1 Tax=Luteimonas endophytica TaxID=3042023 RepID=A0ABT6J6S9_9GAMM|nr:hypothetical protein [Luteimonas endophytica]MDH5822520.1 hypothetical protein [Luteimonas endophytica]